MTIERLTTADRELVIDVLAAAFRDYPVMRFALSDAGAEYGDQLRELIGFFCDARLTRGWPVLGIRQGQELVAAALVSEPRYVPAPPELKRKRLQVARIIGHEAFDRMAQYERQSTGHKPEEPHFFLGMIGVAPGHQGSGYGRILLEHIQAMSEADPVSIGVALSTEDPSNVPYYERVGYRVTGEADVGDIHTWSMFRPNRG